MSHMSIAYYPGCSGMGTSMEYESSTRAVFRHLGVELVDVDDWSCCGSTPAHTVNHVLSAALSGRNLAQVKKMGHEVVATPCPSCLANLKTAAHKAEDEAFRGKINELLDDECPADVNAKSTLQILVEDVGTDAVKESIVRPLAGMKVACYYGCLTTRPPKLMQFDDPENPMSMDDLLTACGAEVVPFPLKVECCGAAAGMPRRDIASELSGKLLDVASELAVDAIVAACPLCQMNLDLRQGQCNRARGTRHEIPVFYFTQLMGLAMGLSEQDLGLSKLAVDPKPCLARMGVR